MVIHPLSPTRYSLFLFLTEFSEMFLHYIQVCFEQQLDVFRFWLVFAPPEITARSKKFIFVASDLLESCHPILRDGFFLDAASCRLIMNEDAEQFCLCYVYATPILRLYYAYATIAECCGRNDEKKVSQFQKLFLIFAIRLNHF